MGYVKIKRTDDAIRLTEWVGLRHPNEIYVSSVNVSYDISNNPADIVISDVKMTDNIDDAYEFDITGVHNYVEQQAAIKLLELNIFEAVEENELWVRKNGL